MRVRAYYALVCGHWAPAPAPRPENGDAEILPAWVECPRCGIPQRVDGYTSVDEIVEVGA